MNLKHISSQELNQRLAQLVRKESEILHVIIEHIKEIDARKAYLEFGFPSLFEYLTKALKYSSGSAQRRIDAARLSQEIPQIADKIKAGTITLHQCSEIQRAARQIQKSDSKRISREQKLNLVMKLENQGTQQTQKIVAQEFDIKPVQSEKTKTQADESTRVEMSLSKLQMELLKKCQELVGHIKPGANIAETFEIVAEEFIKRRDPAASKRPYAKASQQNHDIHCQMEVKNRAAIPAATKRLVFQRDRHCQYKFHDHKCESRYLLQVDHKIPVWAGGTNSLSNLQLLCAAHNQQKYRTEQNIRLTS